MKKAPGFIKFVGSQSSQQWSRRVVMVLAAATLFAGCSKKAEQPVSTTQNTNTSADAAQPTPAAPASTTPQQAATPSPAATEPDLAGLNRAIRRWLVANRRVPKNFDEFAATAGVPIPPPPAGKKYVLEKDMHIQLVDVK